MLLLSRAEELWREVVEIKVTKEDEDQMWIVKSYKGHTHNIEIYICIYNSTNIHIYVIVQTLEWTNKQNEKNHCA